MGARNGLLCFVALLSPYFQTIADTFLQRLEQLTGSTEFVLLHSRQEQEFRDVCNSNVWGTAHLWGKLIEVRPGEAMGNRVLALANLALIGLVLDFG